MIHLKHKDNGYHIVYAESEAKICEKMGWKRCDMAKEHAEARAAKEAAKKAIETEKADGEKIVEIAKKGKKSKK